MDVLDISASAFLTASSDTIKESFKAAHNNLVGTIPESVCLLTSLSECNYNISNATIRKSQLLIFLVTTALFDVQDNEITGSIPLNFGNATDLGKAIVYEGYFVRNEESQPSAFRNRQYVKKQADGDVTNVYV